MSTGNLPPNGGEMYRAGFPSPGARLLAAIGLARPGQVVADLGCDHGKLAVYLALAGMAKKVIAVDKRPLPLSRARALAEQTGCAAQVDCRLGDGLAPLKPYEATEIVMAGMSGETMVRILGDTPWIQSEGVHLIFVPTTRAEGLRRWLYRNGFALQQELPLEVRGKIYTVLSAGYTGQRLAMPPYFMRLVCSRKTTCPPPSPIKPSGCETCKIGHWHRCPKKKK